MEFQKKVFLIQYDKMINNLKALSIVIPVADTGGSLRYMETPLSIK